MYIYFWILLISGFFITLFILDKWLRKESKVADKLKILICIAVYIMFYFGAREFTIGNWAKRSTVDITPILLLENVDTSDMDCIIKKLQNDENELGIRLKMYSIYNTVKSGGYDYYDWSIPASVSVTFAFYENSEQAKKQFRNNEYSRPMQPKYVQISNDIEASLGKSVVVRAVDTFYDHLTTRTIKTAMRVNNMIIWFDEKGLNNDTIGQTTSEAIEILCKVLAEE